MHVEFERLGVAQGQHWQCGHVEEGTHLTHTDQTDCLTARGHRKVARPLEKGQNQYYMCSAWPK